MKIKRIVVKHSLRRFITVVCFSVGFIVWQYQKTAAPVPAVFLVHIPAEPETIIQNRNLSEYDYGGIIRSCFNNFEIPAKKCEAGEKQARDFILKHWQNKKRAYLIAEYAGTDVSGEYYVFIEPDNSGQWEVIWREDVGASEFFQRGSNGFGANIEIRTARFIKTKRAVNEEDDHLHKPGTSYLIFLDKNGKHVASF